MATLPPCALIIIGVGATSPSNFTRRSLMLRIRSIANPSPLIAFGQSMAISASYRSNSRCRRCSASSAFVDCTVASAAVTSSRAASLLYFFGIPGTCRNRAAICSNVLPWMRKSNAMRWRSAIATFLTVVADDIGKKLHETK